jgi:hypothetical protein
MSKGVHLLKTVAEFSGVAGCRETENHHHMAPVTRHQFKPQFHPQQWHDIMKHASQLPLGVYEYFLVYIG